MLVHLSISNLAVIEAAEMSFFPGLNTLTGETGAGKSIVIGALSLVLGDRAKSDTVRHGFDKAEVRALFRLHRDSDAVARLVALDLVEEGVGTNEATGAEVGAQAGAGADDGRVELVVRRIISTSGRGRVYINGVLSSVKTLAKVMYGLVDISSQHQHTALLKSDGHLRLLDRFGGLGAQLEGYRGTYLALVGAQAHRDSLTEREQSRLEREDFIRFQLDEITTLAPTAGEVETLIQERERLLHADRLVQGTRGAERKLSGATGSCLDSLGEAAQSVLRLASIDAGLGPLAARIEETRIEVEDIAYDLSRYASGIDADPRRLDELQDRLEALRLLERKHGGSLELVLERAIEMERELAGFESLEIDIKEAEEAVQVARLGAQDAADALTASRLVTSREMSARVTEELRSLAMTGATVAMPLQLAETLGKVGQDVGELLIETNAGEPLKQLYKVASGGELSRLLLAFKRALIQVDPVETCVFDEVDTGVGGAIAEVIGRKLADIADERQVIAITHLPQIAAFAGHHLVVVKRDAGGRVSTSVDTLDAEQRVSELARMSGGVEITEATLAHASEMLRQATASRGTGTAP